MKLDLMFNRTTALASLNNLRAKVRAWVGGIFSAPYLPRRCVIFYLVLAGTHIAIIFMN